MLHPETMKIEIKMSCKYIAVACLLWFSSTRAFAANVSDDYEKARQLYIAGSYPKVIVAVTKLLSLEDISQTNRANLYTFRGVAYSQEESYEKALEDLSIALTLAPKNSLGDIHYQRFFPHFNLGRADEAYKDMLFVAQGYPDDAQYFRISIITEMARSLKERNRHELFSLLSALDQASYVGNEPLEFTDWLYVDLLREYVKRQQFQDAKRLLEKFVNANVLTDIRLDHDFQALWVRPEFDQLLDFRDFPRRQLENAQMLLTNYPKSWKSLADVTYALRINGRNEEAVALARSAVENSGYYTFEPDHELWLKNELAYALQALGRADEASAVMEPTTKSNLKKNERPVNQILNYGAMLMARGETQKAIRAVQKTEGFLSNRGSLVVKYVTACSLQQSNRADEARSILADMLVNDDGGVDIVIKTLACLNETEQLAQYVIKQLADKEEKLKVLRMLNKCNSNPLAPAMDSEIERRLANLHERPDVNKAIAAIGTVLTFQRSCSDF
jgi:tetratricopeptide (TPR) repeat protein